MACGEPVVVVGYCFYDLTALCANFELQDPAGGRLCGASAYLHIEVAAERAQKVLAYLPYPLKYGLKTLSFYLNLKLFTLGRPWRRLSATYLPPPFPLP